MTTRQKALVGLGLFMSAIFLYFAFRNLSPEQFSESIRDIQLAWIIIGALSYFIAVAIISLRWQYLLRGIQHVPLRGLIPLVCIGYMGNNVYPFRSGEALRIYLLRRNHRVPIVKGTTTVLVERIFDGIVMLSFILLALLFVDSTSPHIRRVALVAAPIFGTALAVFLIIASKPELARSLIRIAKRLLPDPLANIIGQIGEDVIAGLESLRQPQNLIGAVISSYATWSVEAGVYWLVSLAFDLNTSYMTMLLVVGTVNLAGLIPASPGQLGVFEFFVRSVLVGAGLEAATALAYAITVHMVIWAPVTLVGFFFLVRQGLGWSAITHAHDLEAGSSAPTEYTLRQEAKP